MMYNVIAGIIITIIIVFIVVGISCCLIIAGSNDNPYRTKKSKKSKKSKRS